MKIKQTGLDRLFSQYIRLRDGFTCRYSGTKDGLMDCAHIFSRRHLWTRWHPDNAVCLARRWHMYFTEHPHEWADWARKIFGNERIDYLQHLSRSSKKMTDGDKHAIMCDLIQRIKSMGEKPCWQGNTRKTKKKKSKYKRKVSGEVVLREG